MKQTILPKLAFDKLFSIFHGASDNASLLRPGSGEGIFQTFKPEKGLEVIIGDSLYSSGEAFNNNTLPANENHCFHLTYFLQPQGPAAMHASDTLQKDRLWNNIADSVASDFNVSIVSTTRYRFVAISFSRDWLLDVLQTNCTLQQLKENINTLEKLELMQSITADEINILEDLVHRSEHSPLGTLFIKSAVLKLVCDYLYNLMKEQLFLTGTVLPSNLDGVERYLCANITKEFAGTKVLAKQFNMSESTLKRNFKKKFGVSTTVYLTRKKMHFAGKLMQEKAITLAEAARMVGYRSVQNFKEMFRKYGNVIPDTYQG